MIEIWAHIQQILQKRLSPGLFKVWITPLAAEVVGKEIRLTAPNDFVASWVRDRLLDDISAAAAEAMGLSQDDLSATVERPVVSVCASKTPQKAPARTAVRSGGAGELLPGLAQQADQAGQTDHVGQSNAVFGAGVAAEVGSCDSYGTAFGSAVPGQRFSGAGGTQYPMAQQAGFAQARQMSLPISQPLVSKVIDWRFDFESFVVGPSNNLAFAASQGITRSSLSADTLFLSSGPGLGKTHLMQAVGNELCRSSNRSRVRVEYLTAEEFGTRLIAALKSREVDRFKARYRDVDLLLLEDVHFLQGKERMQDEVLATIKALQSRGSRVVLSSSFAPRDLKELDNQLVSRFCSGFLAAIERPDFATRRDILRRKASQYQVTLPDNVTDLLAENIRTDVRQIESCLHNLILKARILNQQISMNIAWEVISQYASHETIMDMDSIIRCVCNGFDLSPSQLNSRSRRRELVVARNTVFYLARKHTDMSLKDIGDHFNRKHSTVLKGITNLEREMSRETPIGRQVSSTVAMIERNGRVLYT